MTTTTHHNVSSRISRHQVSTVVEGKGNRWVIDVGDSDSHGGGGCVRWDAVDSLFSQQQSQLIGTTTVTAWCEQQPRSTKGTVSMW